MSHFLVGVFSEENGKSVEQLMAPFHEFECTGHNDEYIQEIDQLGEAKKEYEEYTFTKLKSADGALFSPYDDRFYRDPTEEEKREIGPIAGSGCGKGLSWSSKDWGDGLGYRTKVRYIPEDYKEVEVKAAEIMTLRDFIDYYYERKPVFEGETPDIEDQHKYGWMRLNSKGEVIELIRRTNPNKRWDYWQVGGRYSGRLMLKSTATSGQHGSRSLFNLTEVIPENMVDSALVKDIDFEKMKQKKLDEHEQWWKEAEGKNDTTRYFEYGIEKDMSYEQYMAQCNSFTTFAVVLPDGTWYERGEMGWWACVSNEETEWDQKYQERFIDTAKPEWTLTMVDCHI